MARSVSELYVDASGSDDDGDGSEGKPYASLARAVEEAYGSNESCVIYVTSDLKANESARYWGVDVAITSKGGPWTVTRGEDFDATIDQARGGYNGPIIEVGNGGSLTITNLTIDDAGRRAGSHFVQVESGGEKPGSTWIGGEWVDNHAIVQDAMISTFSGDSTITLGEGCKLKNFGGMSAVRVANGTLVMQDGSEIFDGPDPISRNKQTGDYGYAGAVWVQSGEFVLQQGSSIRDTSGHAVYADGDGSSVDIDGTIHDVTTSSQAWQGENGGALHLRGGAEAEVSGVISNVTGSEVKNDKSVVYATGGGSAPSSLTLGEGARIENNGENIVGVQLFGNNGVQACVDGEITGIGNSAIHVNTDGNGSDDPESMQLVIGPNAYIHGNNGAGYGTVTVQSKAAKVDVYGKIVENASSDHSGLCMANNFGTKTVTLHDGAEISRNYSSGGVSGVRVSLGTLVMEEGAVIEGNISASKNDGAGVWVTNGGQFIMQGGRIAGNSSAGKGGGVSVDANPFATRYAVSVPYAQLEGGSITGGLMNATVTSAEGGGNSVSGGDPNDLTVVGGATYGNVSRFLSVSDLVSLSEQSIFMDDYDFFLEKPGDGVKLGNASSGAEAAATGAYGDNGLTAVKGSFWFQSSRASETFAISRLGTDEGKPVYAAVVPTTEDGAPDSQKAVSLVPVEIDESGAVSVTVLSSGANGQAVVFLQEGDQESSVVTIKPADLTAYMGGEHGYSYVDSEGNPVELESIPTPGFNVELPKGWDASQVRLKAEVGGEEYAWKLERYSEGSKDVFKIVPDGTDGTQVKLQFINESGEAVESDEFEFKDSLGQELVMRAYGDGIAESDVTVTCGEKSALLASGTGILTVRGTTKHEQYALPNASLTAGTPGLKAPEGTEYTINGGSVKVADEKGIALLFDNIIETDGKYTNADLLEKHAEEAYFKGDGGDRNYELKYLDLVDRNNGNVWVKANEPVTVCWPLPEGTNSGDEFTVLHFKGLHREMGVGYIASEIDKADVEKLGCKVVGDHVEFEVTPGNFSPFALVWTEEGDDPVNPPQPQTVTLHYETNGGRPLADEVHVVGSKVELKTPLREGCTFAGWYLDAELTKPAESPLAMDSNKTVWAKWESTSVPGGFASEHVNYVVGRKTDEGRLIEPESNITRAEVAAMFYRLLDDDVRDEYYRESSTFPDVEAGAWYEVPVATLQAMGIIRGDDPAGTCRPGDPITRAEFAAMAGRFDDDGEWPDMEPFADMDGHWAERIVLVAAKNGWVLGDEGSDKFRPDDPITRAEAITITNRVLQRIPESESDLLPGRVEWPDNQDKGKWYWLAVEEATNNHDHTLKGDGSHERWTALLKNEDWE